MSSFLIIDDIMIFRMEKQTLKLEWACEGINFETFT